MLDDHDPFCGEQFYLMHGLLDSLKASGSIIKE